MNSVDTGSFVIIGSLLKGIICLIIFIFISILDKGKGITIKNDIKKVINIRQNIIPILLLLLVGLSNVISSYCILTGAINVPATVLYPLISGGSIFLTTVLDLIIFKEKPNKFLAIGIILCIVGIVCFI
jgi:drug/metabolite transporter (DMT)-like permease